MSRYLPVLQTAAVLVVLVSLCIVVPSGSSVEAAQSTLYISPSQGTFEVGSTFDVSFFVNTGGESINAVRLDLTFPPDLLQIANPTAGKSFIEIWVVPPEYSNTNGTVSLQGGIPNPGVNTSAGLITTISFRAKAPGTAVISVGSTSQVLANDGNGTDVLSISPGQVRGTYAITVPPPEGPVITSSTHADQNKWYRDTNPSFSWTVKPLQSADGTDFPVSYSWSLDQDISGVPDNELDGSDTFTSYEGIESGIWYFHVRAHMEGIWGNVSHYVVKVDNLKPAKFSPTVEPSSGGEDVRRVVSFMTTDQHSGIDHYEMKVEHLSDPDADSSFFVEASSPFSLPNLENGKYKVTVRAFDVAGNYRDGEVEFTVSMTLFALTAQGLQILSVTIPWWAVGLLAVVLIGLLILIVALIRRRRQDPSGELEGYLSRLKKKIGGDQKKLEEQSQEQQEVKEVLEKEVGYLLADDKENGQAVLENQAVPVAPATDPAAVFPQPSVPQSLPPQVAGTQSVSPVTGQGTGLPGGTPSGHPS